MYLFVIFGVSLALFDTLLQMKMEMEMVYTLTMYVH